MSLWLTAPLFSSLPQPTQHGTLTLRGTSAAPVLVMPPSPHGSRALLSSPSLPPTQFLSPSRVLRTAC